MAQSVFVNPSGLQTTQQISVGGTTDGRVTSSEKIVTTYTGLQDAAATPTQTVTIPNSAQAALLRVTIVGSLGAGGAIGAFEASSGITRDLAVVRTSNLLAVTSQSNAYGSTSTARVAGADTITTDWAASSVSGGATGANNTFTINVTITKGAGSSQNHVCTVTTEVINILGGGITVVG